jgi:hypothetical protein
MLQTTTQAAKPLNFSIIADNCSGVPLRISFRMYFTPFSEMPVTTHGLSFRCLEHVVNLANVAIMSHITKIAAIENTNAIWEYDPELPGNRVLGGSLDVVAVIRTLTVKVRNRPLW